VVIVGAGPAGATLALLLCRAGIGVTLVESNPGQRRCFRGEALMPSGLAALEQMALLPQLEALPHRPLAGWRIVVNGRELFTAAEPLGGDPQRPCTLVSQPAFLDGVLGQALATNHLELLGQTTAKQLILQAGRIAGVVLGDGRRLAAELVVACDGRSSRLRQEAGISLSTGSSPIDVLWFDLDGPGGGPGTTPNPSPLQGHFTTVVGPQGVFSLFESATGGIQLGWVLDATKPTPQRSPQEWIASFASQCPPDLASWLGQSGSGLQTPTRLSVQVGLAESWWKPGLLLLGDAAHPMSPVRAQGINMALRDAWVASQHLIPVLQPLNQTLNQPQNQFQQDSALAAIEQARRSEIQTLQALQAQEAQRGELLRHNALLRCALATSAPWIGGALGHHWSQLQQPLREGLATLPPAP
jgi:2-polyprenyl-6-methoxyphenol hydroxylase-like FAD-dependent oxidoreductase